MAARPPGLPAALLDAAVRRAPAAPLVTFYDDDHDARIELSATTVANWVAKTANLLQDEFDIGAGSRVAVTLPPHWQTAAVLLAVWRCGAAVVDAVAQDDGVPLDVDLVVAVRNQLPALEDALAAAGPGAPELLGVSLHPLGLGMSGYTGPARDYALEVRAAADVFTPYQPAAAADPGLIAGGVHLSLADLVHAAGELAARLELRTGDRVLIDDRTAAEAGPVAWLLAPLRAGASILLCQQPGAEELSRRAASEHVTVTMGPDVPGIRRVGRHGGNDAP